MIPITRPEPFHFPTVPSLILDPYPLHSLPGDSLKV